VRAVAVWWPSGEPEEVERLAALTSVAQLRDEIQAKLVATVDAVVDRSGASGVAVSTEVLYGHPAQKLVHTAGIDGLLVVGSRGLGAIRGTLVGSVGLSCAQYADGCVAVIRGRPPADHPGPVLVGVDGSTESLAALRFAAEAAAVSGSALHVLHAWVAPYWATAMWSPPIHDIDESRAVAAATLRNSVSAALGDAPGPRVEQSVLEGPAGPALVEAAREADLLVVGSRGRGGWKALLLGSVSMHCITHAPGPVVVVREPARSTSDGG
jgi:nucleotide-binding universal stress UspA family protein